jgi:hypothetical protein
MAPSAAGQNSEDFSLDGAANDDVYGAGQTFRNGSTLGHVERLSFDLSQEYWAAYFENPITAINLDEGAGTLFGAGPVDGTDDFFLFRAVAATAEPVATT